VALVTFEAIFDFLSKMTPGGAGIWTGVFMFAAYLIREWRESRKMTTEDRQAKREGFSKQVELLQAENRKLREDLVRNENLHDDYRHACQMETDGLRQQVRGLEDEVTGFKRRLDSQATTLGRAVLGMNAPTAGEKFGGGE
jgi:hypothetical protein